MTTLTLELSPEQYVRLRVEAERLGKPQEELAREWLAERKRPSAQHGWSVPTPGGSSCDFRAKPHLAPDHLR